MELLQYVKILHDYKDSVRRPYWLGSFCCEAAGEEEGEGEEEDVEEEEQERRRRKVVSIHRAARDLKHPQTMQTYCQIGLKEVISASCLEVWKKDTHKIPYVLYQ